MRWFNCFKTFVLYDQLELIKLLFSLYPVHAAFLTQDIEEVIGAAKYHFNIFRFIFENNKIPVKTIKGELYEMKCQEDLMLRESRSLNKMLLETPGDQKPVSPYSISYSLFQLAVLDTDTDTDTAKSLKFITGHDVSAKSI